MKFFLLFLLIFFSLSISAQVLEWGDLELKQNLILKQEILFINEGLIIPAGTKMEVQDFIGLPINVELYQIQLTQCSFPEKTAEMILIEPLDKTDRAVGIDLKENCVLEIFVELKDLYSKSLFNKI